MALAIPRVFSGIQPSGELHIGNFLGAVQAWVEFQHRTSRTSAWWTITRSRCRTCHWNFAAARIEMAISLLAAGIDPSVATLFVQSAVPEHTELAWIFNTITPLGELERQTQFKEKAQRQESVAAGMLNYPVSPGRGHPAVPGGPRPVGEDQVQHLELTREIARRWNARFAPGDAFFPEPKAN